MNKMIAVVFANESEAYAGARSMRQLDAEGSLSLYALSVIAKDADGKVSIKESSDQSPIGTGVGMAVGGLIGMLGGPAGMAVGAVAGTLAGALRDYWVAGVGIDFVEETEKFLRPGKVAVIAEIEEEWVVPVDAAMEAAGGLVFRRARADMEEAQLDRDISAIKAEIAELKAEYRQATGTAKTRLQSRMDAAMANLERTLQRAKEQIEAMEQEANARVSSLEERLAKAQGALRTRLKNRVAHVRGAYAKRSARLRKAWDRAKKILAG